MNKDIIKKDYSQEVFQHYLSSFTDSTLRPGKTFKSPLREEKHPSFNVFIDKNGEWKYKDFADEGGDCIDLVMKMYNLSMPDAVKKISEDVKIGSPPGNNHKPFVQTSDYSTEIKSFSDSELSYWAQYGITKDILEIYNVYSLAKYSGTYNDKPYNVDASEDNPIFGYLHTGWAKIYRPLSPDKKKKFRHLGKKPSEYVFGLEHLIETGEYVFFTAGEKDVMSLRGKGFEAISLNSETGIPSKELIASLKSRFANVCVLYDNDETGISRSKKLANDHGLLRIQLPEIKEGKDISDYFKTGGKAESIHALVIEEVQRKHEKFWGFLGKRVFNSSIEYIEPIKVITVGDCTLSTAGNVTTFLGQSKSGKTAVTGGIIAGSIRVPGTNIDTLGLEVKANPDRKGVLHFDTEQSEYDWHRFNKGVLNRAKRIDEPEYYKSIWLRDFTPKARKKTVDEAFSVMAEVCGGLHIAILDGIADFVTSVNEDAECLEFIEHLLALGSKYQIPIITVIHLNPGQNLKGRGHLGSHLERKSESLIAITKEGEISRIEPIYLRNGGSSDFPTLLNRYDKTKWMWVNVGKKMNKEDEKAVELHQMAIDIFSDGKELKSSELSRIIAEGKPCSRQTAERYIYRMAEMGFIVKGSGKFGTYALAPYMNTSNTSTDDELLPF